MEGANIRPSQNRIIIRGSISSDLQYFRAVDESGKVPYVLSSSAVLPTTTYAIGVLRGGSHCQSVVFDYADQLHLTPLDSVHQLRPSTKPDVVEAAQPPPPFAEADAMLVDAPQPGPPEEASLKHVQVTISKRESERMVEARRNTFSYIKVHINGDVSLTALVRRR